MRALAVGLTAYGVSGLIILVIVTSGVLRGLDQVGELTLAIEQQRVSLSAALDAADRTMGSTATALAGVNGSLAEAQVSLTQVATLAADLSSTMGTLASALNVTILGSQPFAETSAGFSRAAIALQTVAGELGRTSAALGSNATDVLAVESELLRLQASVAAVRDGLGDVSGTAVSGADVGTLRLVIGALLAWLAVQAIAAAVVGVVLLGRIRAKKARL